MKMCGVQMIEVCEHPELLQQAQVLEQWADCRDRAIARLELKIEQLENQHRTDEATRLRSAARYLRGAALRDRLHAAELRRKAQM
jgi:hypothetical protein